MAELGDVYSMSINGQLFPGGYLDVGLIDTMTDILVETAGAILYTVIYIAGQGKFFVFEPLETTSQPCKETQAATPVESAQTAAKKTEVSVAPDNE